MMRTTSLSFFVILVVKASVAAHYETCYYPAIKKEICRPTVEEIKEAFTIHMIVPQIIPVAPKSIITKFYGDFVMCLGNRIPPWETTGLPFTSFPRVIPTALYTILAIDPDYPQFFYNSNGTQLLVELICNIPASNFSAGDLLTPFKSIAPYPGSKEHRYIYLIYKQPEPIIVTTELLYRYATDYERFSISDFVNEYKMGNPVSGNFYLAGQSLCEYPDCYSKGTYKYNELNSKYDDTYNTFC